MDLECPAELRGALANVHQAESGLGEWELDAGPVVLDLEDQPIGDHEGYQIAGSPRVFAGVCEALSHNGQDVVADVLGYVVVYCPVEADLGAGRESPRQLLCEMKDGLAQPTRKGGVPELEDGRADLGDGLIELVNSPRDPLDDLLALGHPGGALQAHADRVDALDDPVVKIAGDPVPVVENTHDADPVVEPGVLNSDAGCQGEGLGERLVLVGELGRTLLVGQVEVAVHIVPDANRHS